MAWRPELSVLRGEFDFTVRGKISGRLWLAGANDPVTIELEGLPSPDLAGHRLRLVNPEPATPPNATFPSMQKGVAGLMTASRKVRVPDDPDFMKKAGYDSDKPFAWHWGNAVYLEWFSDAAGRVVIESTSFEVTIEPVGAWQPEAGDEEKQDRLARDAMMGFLDKSTPSAATDFEDWLPDEEEAPRSTIEAEADAETARMDLLLDRVTRRLRQEGERAAEDFDRIYREEREKLRKELGEPEPEPLTPEQQREREEWIEEMNRVAAEAVEELAENPSLLEEPEDHPLVERCMEFSIRARKELLAGGVISDDDSPEHPLQEWVFLMQSASAKLAGALNCSFEEKEWPPPPIFAGDVLVRLKKARGFLKDGLRMLRSAEEDHLAPVVWIAAAGRENVELLDAVEELIREVRDGLEN
jgi:hypothetical protein